MREPLVSVIVPTFNRSKLLGIALGSVQAQTYQQWELIVVDDGSTDDTPRVLTALDDPRIRVVRLEHTDNPARVRNAGIAIAQGTYVAFLDDDDLWSKDKLLRQVRGLTTTASRWGYTAFRRIDETGTELPESNLAPWRPHRGWILESLLTIEAVVPLPTVMVERSLLTEVGGFDEAFPDCEDYELWFRLAARAPAQVEDAKLAAVRVHPRHRQANRERVHASWIAVYEKTARSAGPPRVVAVCVDRRAEHQMLLARVLAQRGDRLGALALLARSARRTAGRPVWWKSLGLAVLPNPVVAVLRTLRGSHSTRTANGGVHGA